MLRRLLHRLRASLRRGKVELEMERELRFHLEMETAKNIRRGMSEEEARLAAQRSFGGVEQTKEKLRDASGARWLEDLLQDFRYAVRGLRRKPGFAAVVLLTFALGSGTTTVMFTVINGVLLKPLSYPEPDRLITVHGFTEKFGEFWGFSNPNFIDAKHASRSLDLAAWTYGGGTISGSGEPEYLNGRLISAELCSTLGITLAQGRAFRPEDDQQGAPPVAIISYGLWRRRYGENLSAIGGPLVLDGKPYTIVGIAPARFQFFDEVDVFTPLGQNTEPRMLNREANFIHVLARLKPDVEPTEAQAELTLISRQLAKQYPKSNEGLSMLARPLRQELVGDIGSTLWLLLGAVSLVLLIACVNIASLLLARAVSRDRELAVRAALGARRGRLARQCLTESAVLSVSGGAIGVALAAIGVSPFIAFWPDGLPRAEEISLDWRVLLFALAVSIVSGLLFGLAPALRVPARGLEQALRDGARNIAGSSRRLHSAFVISEIALAVVLLISAGTLGRALLKLSSLNPGVDARNVLTARFALSSGALSNSGQIRATWQEALERASRMPDVESVALTDIVPMRDGENSLPYWSTPTPPPPNQAPYSLASSVTPDYLKVMGIPLRQGRFFDERDRLDGEPVIVIDENLARHAFGGADAVGKHLWSSALGPAPVRVVGVVGHVRHWGLAGDDQSRVRDQMYYPLAQVPDRLLRFFSSVMSIAVRTKIPPLNVVEPLRRELRGAAGDQVLYDVHDMDQLIVASLARQRFLLLLFGIFAGLALLLACVGIYGVLSYLTGLRAPEIGVRMALGASARDCMWLVLRQSLGMILVGVVLGAATAVATGRLLWRLVPGAQPTEPMTFAIMISVLVGAALLASFAPARRASRVDPISALRQE